MSSRESRAVFRGSARRRRWSKEKDPPNMSDLRIVLLGKSVSENSQVGNFILGRAAFDSEAPPDVVERVGGRLKDRRVMVINSPQLLQTHISDHQITQTVRECVSLSDPGPHVFILVLQYKDFTEEDMRRVKHVLEKFSEEAIKRTIVLTTDEEKLRAKGASVKANEFIQQLAEVCGGGHLQLDHEIQRQFSGILQQLEKILRENNEDFLTCELCHDAEETLVDEDLSRTFASLRTEEDLDGGVSATRQQKLNLVLCGSDETLKNSVSKLISEKKDVELHGRVISLVELPALFNTRLSEEEVMRQTLHCVSLCHPGVHVFLLIIPDPLNNEDKAEMEEIQRIFSSRINKHIMILIMQNSEHQTAELNEETQSVIESFGGRHHFFGPTTQVSTLMENIEKMLEENRGEFFSTETFREAQMKKLLKVEEIKKKINSLETPLQLQGSRENTDELRIVLLGKTGVGKSAAGNTILGREAFTAETSQESVTKESQRETSDINGRHVTVIDTPGLFDTELTNEEIQREIRHCISMILPGPHVFIIVLNLGQRFTREEATSVKIIQETFGEKSLMFTMVLFTRGDDLKDKTIDQCLGKPGSPLMNLIEVCGNRYHVFNNNQTGDRTQVSDLLEKIDDMVKANGESFYSCKMFRQMERENQKQQMKILMDRVREREEEMNKLEEEKERMMMVMEEERQNHDKERKRREEELKREIREQEKHQREIREEMRRERETFKHEIEEMRQEKWNVKKEKENLQIRYDTEIHRLMNRIENERQNHDKERKRREEEFNARVEHYKTLMKEKEESEEKMREEMKRGQETFKHEKEETRQEKEKIKTEIDRLMNRIANERQNHETERKRREEEFNEREKHSKIEMKEKEKLMKKYEEEKERIKMMTEEERQNHDKERKRREEEFREVEVRYKREMKEKEEQIRDEMKREREMLKNEMEELRRENENVKKEKENLQIRNDTEIDRMMKTIENERKKREEFNEREEQYKTQMKEKEELMKKLEEEKERNDEERKRREDDIREREEQYKREIKEKEESEEKIREQMKREREEWKKQKLEEKKRREEDDEKRRVKEQIVCDDFNQRLKEERERMEREKEDIQSKHKEEENKMKILTSEREELMKKHEEEKERMMMMMEEERQNHDKERKRGEEEFNARVEHYKTLMKEKEESEEKMCEEMKRERETFKHEMEEIRQEKEKITIEKEKVKTEYETKLMQWEKQEQDERQKREEEKKKEHQQKSDLHKKQQRNRLECDTTREAMLKPNPLMRKTPDNNEPDAPVSSPSSRRIVLLGKSGVGKSSSGNTILGRREFDSVMRMNAVTRESSDAHATVSGRSVSVVDTPGFFDTLMRHEELAKEIAKSVYISSPGPHAFLIVIRVIDRFTEQEQQILQMIEMLFGEEVLKYSIILFTHGDLLRGKSVEKLIEENCRLRDLVGQCGGRFHVFNNEDENNRDQVNDLLMKIDTMIEQNGGGHYRNQMYEDADKQQNKGCVCS